MSRFLDNVKFFYRAGIDEQVTINTIHNKQRLPHRTHKVLKENGVHHKLTRLHKQKKNDDWLQNVEEPELGRVLTRLA